ncbi:VacB and RNase II family 3'-5' exoribonuclease [Spizellomyces punctatus DAOM BR117]|uniref:DIS3-like exonuclease 2 n=1 Tax=Spizellomyces punctatus (strain DAOM BR117) TaxID=645134 RepID=A0A0L0HNT5_SPIPD|nr:VacB and RNase II family 3'-5' exoribonuclease [Spizellomyces punctatus DAOM BR117]KND02723.1 VacB and RNase II family 3'-5' exoribonuclease [Spizellomyces punctatus DAOM BR117]|eukprot:XP_016610762.1 VacB and RNase II family 3'-5' exoribonuclease [Spizellomyces punctatus DAOM BR117]
MSSASYIPPSAEMPSSDTFPRRDSHPGRGGKGSRRGGKSGYDPERSSYSYIPPPHHKLAKASLKDHANEAYSEETGPVSPIKHSRQHSGSSARRGSHGTNEGSGLQMTDGHASGTSEKSPVHQSSKIQSSSNTTTRQNTKNKKNAQRRDSQGHSPPIQAELETSNVGENGTTGQGASDPKKSRRKRHQRKSTGSRDALDVEVLEGDGALQSENPFTESKPSVPPSDVKGVEGIGQKKSRNRKKNKQKQAQHLDDQETPILVIESRTLASGGKLLVTRSCSTSPRSPGNPDVSYSDGTPAPPSTLTNAGPPTSSRKLKDVPNNPAHDACIRTPGRKDEEEEVIDYADLTALSGPTPSKRPIRKAKSHQIIRHEGSRNEAASNNGNMKSHGRPFTAGDGSRKEKTLSGGRTDMGKALAYGLAPETPKGNRAGIQPSPSIRQAKSHEHINRSGADDGVRRRGASARNETPRKNDQQTSSDRQGRTVFENEGNPDTGIPLSRKKERGKKSFGEKSQANTPEGPLSWRQQDTPASASASPRSSAVRESYGSPRASPHVSARRNIYEEYITSTQVAEGLKDGTLKLGSLRINKRNRFDSYVSVNDDEQDIYICGMKNRNRAFEGDVVVVMLLEGQDLQKEVNGERNRREQRRKSNQERQAKCDVVAEGYSSEEELAPEDEEDIDVENRVYGKVVYISERRQDRSFAGTLQFDSPISQMRDRHANRDRPPKIVWFKPSDKRVALLAIPIEHAPKDFLQDPVAYQNILFKAAVLRWPASSQHPFGVVTGTLGQMGEISIETDALLVDAGVTWDAFSDEVLACLPPVPWSIPQEEYRKRRDLRSERIFSIDPQTARDLDDAVSVKPLGDGTFEVGVHIADVTHFVRPGTALDKEARHRATTVYLVQKAIPMLPRLLCEELCSLNPGVERLAFSVIWKMNSSAMVIGTPWFGRTIIKSCAKLSYDHAQRLIDGKDWEGLPQVEISGNTTIEDIKGDVLRLYEFSKMMRRRRFENGALSIQNVKLWFAIDDYGNPVSTGVYEIKDSNKLIEEFMLLANMAVAQKISSRFSNSALLRNHRNPLKRSMDEFVAFAAKLGYTIDSSTSASLQTSFESIPHAFQRSVLQQLCIKPMQRAKYFCTGAIDITKWHHYALNVPLYTHFTSPIRRYCDVMVHRMLEAAIDNVEYDIYNTKEVTLVAKQCNDRKDASKDAQEASQKLFLCAYLKRLCEKGAVNGTQSNQTSAKDGIFAEAIVYNVGTRGFDVLVPKYGLEKRIWLEDSIELGEVVGCEEVKGEVGKLRIYWKKDSNGMAAVIGSLENLNIGDAEDAVDIICSGSDASSNGKPEGESANPESHPNITPCISSNDSVSLRDNSSSLHQTPSTPAGDAKATKPKRRTFDPATVDTQTVRIFDRVWVRIVPDLTKSPPEIRVFAVKPGKVAFMDDIGEDAVGVQIDVSCPGIVDDAE